MGCSESKEATPRPKNPLPHSHTHSHPLPVPQSSQDKLLARQHASQESSLVEAQLQSQLDQQLEQRITTLKNELTSTSTTKSPSLSHSVTHSQSNSSANNRDTLAVDNITVTLTNSIPIEENPETKRITRINNIRAELLSTEQSYVTNMTTAMDAIMLPLINGKIIDAEIAADQFNDFIAIAKFNRIMLDEFEARPSELLATMRKYMSGLKMYASYLQHFERRMHVRAKLVNNNSLHTFLEKARQNHHSNLESFLVEPVQRIPRYKMLLAEVSFLTLHIIIV
jgi:hypothetical protein